jgi:hypothetical protein
VMLIGVVLCCAVKCGDVRWRDVTWCGVMEPLSLFDKLITVLCCDVE